MAIDFRGAHFPKSVVLYAGVNVDRATLNRWVVRYSPSDCGSSSEA